MSQVKNLFTCVVLQEPALPELPALPVLPALLALLALPVQELAQALPVLLSLPELPVLLAFLAQGQATAVGNQQQVPEKEPLSLKAL